MPSVEEVVVPKTKRYLTLEENEPYHCYITLDKQDEINKLIDECNEIGMNCNTVYSNSHIKQNSFCLIK